MSLGQWALAVIVRQWTPVAQTTSPSTLHPALYELLAICAASGRSVYLFGADAPTLYRLRDHVQAQFPDLHLAGMCDAAFNGPVSKEVLADIVSRRPDVMIADMSAGLLRQVAADSSRLMPGLRIVDLRHAFMSAGLSARAVAWLAQQLPAAAGQTLTQSWRSATINLRFAGLIIRQKLGLPIH